MTNRAITNWWIGGLTAMIPSGFCAVLLATHPQGVSDGYGRIMVGFIVVGVVGGLRRIPVAALAEFVARRKGAFPGQLKALCSHWLRPLESAQST